MNIKKEQIKNGVLYTAGTALIFSGVSMAEDSLHLFHSLQLIITGASLIVLNKFVECK